MIFPDCFISMFLIQWSWFLLYSLHNYSTFHLETLSKLCMWNKPESKGGGPRRQRNQPSNLLSLSLLCFLLLFSADNLRTDGTASACQEEAVKDLDKSAVCTWEIHFEVFTQPISSLFKSWVEFTKKRVNFLPKTLYKRIYRRNGQ